MGETLPDSRDGQRTNAELAELGLVVLVGLSSWTGTVLYLSCYFPLDSTLGRLAVG